MTIPIYYDYIEGHAQQFIQELWNDAPIAIIESDKQYLGEAPTGPPSGDLSFKSITTYRRCIIHAHTASFNCANHRKLCYVVMYKRDKIFNIEPPRLSPHLTTVYDVLRSIPDIVDYPDLPEEDYKSISLLPSGHSIDGIKPYNPDITTANNYQRLNWYLPCQLLDSVYPVHPLFHRPITTDEMIALYRDTTYDWLQRQADLYLSAAWGDNDYETRYDPHLKEFVGNFCKSFHACKHFDISKYTPSAIAPYTEIIPPYRFNIDVNGKLVREWDLVADAFHQYTASKVLEDVSVS